MFLDERLLKIGREAELTKEGIMKAINEMIKACFDNISNNIDSHSATSVILSNFKRIDNTWHLVANTLDKEGRGFIKPEGFKIFVKGLKEFQGLLK